LANVTITILKSPLLTVKSNGIFFLELPPKATW